LDVEAIKKKKATDKDTTSEDSKKIAREMVKRGIDLLIFVGGDGTARDIYDAVGTKVPVVRVTYGVKVFSSVFAVSARAAAETIDEFMRGTDFTEQEVLDIDEDGFRRANWHRSYMGIFRFRR
jgi:predicted polyphosphate/ATP-dependent NAD kinase